MENQPRFDLNAAIADWQQELAAQSQLTADACRELAAHIRDSIADLQKRGMSDEESFRLARNRVGQAHELGHEFGKSAPVKTGEGTNVILHPQLDSLNRWWHPLLVFSLNSTIVFAFLPGRPALWMIMTVIGLMFCLFMRPVGQWANFFQPRSVTYPLFFLAAVALLVFCVSGFGSSFDNVHSETAASQKYLQLLLAILVYFVLSSVKVSPERVGLYVGLYFLSALTGLCRYVSLGNWWHLDGLAQLFPARNGSVPITAFVAMAMAGLFSYLLARHGVRGVFSFSHPRRLALFLLALLGVLFTGLNNQIFMMALVFVTVFCLEGLWRTRYVAGLLGAILAVVLLMPALKYVTMSARHPLSYYPLKMDSQFHANTANLHEQRAEAWKKTLPTISKYFLIGKGYAMNASDAAALQAATGTGRPNPYYQSILEGNSLNGPLTILIPFGIPGMAAFLWFLGAAGWTLYRNYRLGTPEMRATNRFFLVMFIVLAIRFIFLLGALYSDLAGFCVLLGLSASLNGGKTSPAKLQPAPTAAPELVPENARPRVA